MPKIESGGDSYFLLDGLPYNRGQYEPIWDDSGEKFGIRNINTNIQKVPQTVYSDWTDSTDTPYSSFQDLVSDIEAFFFRNLNGGGGVFSQKQGFIDYNDNTGLVTLNSDTWVDVPNDGSGAFTNKTYKPSLINDVIDTNTGYLDFSELTLGSQLIIRNDFKVNPSTNNALLEVRYLLGQGANEYPLLFWSERLDNGSGIDYQRVPVFTIYMGDENTRGGVGKLQIKLSTNGVLTNAGSYINIQLR